MNAVINVILGIVVAGAVFFGVHAHSNVQNQSFITPIPTKMEVTATQTPPTATPSADISPTSTPTAIFMPRNTTGTAQFKVQVK